MIDLKKELFKGSTPLIVRKSSIFPLLPTISILLISALLKGCLAYNLECEAPGDLEDPERIIGYLAEPMLVRRELVRTREMPIGIMIADAYMDAYNNPANPSYRPEVEGVHGAFENAGAIREQGFCSIIESLPGDQENPPGIRRMDLREVLPFTNRVVVVELTSKQIWEVLRHSVSGFGSENPARGHFLHVSGISFSANCLAPDRITSVSIGGVQLSKPDNNNETDEDEPVWRIATNDFLLQREGNDGFTTLAGLPGLNSLGMYSFDVVEDYLSLHSSYEKPYQPSDIPKWMNLVNCTRQ